MTEREEFEAWYLAHIDDKLPPFEPKADYYLDATVDDIWKAWQAGADVERERCAKVCDRVGTTVSPLDHGARTAQQANFTDGAYACAAAIREQK